MSLKIHLQIFFLLWINAPLSCEFLNCIIIMPEYLILDACTYWLHILFSFILDTSYFFLELKSTQTLHKHMWHLLFLILRLKTLISSIRGKKQNNANFANWPYFANSEEEIKKSENNHIPKNCVRSLLCL